MLGEKLFSISLFFLISSMDEYTPADSPARYAAPSAVVSTHRGRSISIPRMRAETELSHLRDPFVYVNIYNERSRCTCGR